MNATTALVIFALVGIVLPIAYCVVEEILTARDRRQYQALRERQQWLDTLSAFYADQEVSA